VGRFLDSAAVNELTRQGADTIDVHECELAEKSILHYLVQKSSRNVEVLNRSTENYRDVFNSL
jgi:G:T-mismatch repair DNA endonuclease (very short patch repair protein)